jgi:hypothetical protein
MTCIVGIAEKGTVWLGGDTCCSNNHTQVRIVDPKVFKKGKGKIVTQ